jgi:thioredoxin-related protein
MRNIIITIVLIVVLVLSLLVGISKKEHKKVLQSNAFSGINLDDFTLINEQDKLLQDKLALVFFSTHCSLCSYELEQLKYKAYTEIDFLFCSLEPKDSILQYIRYNDFEPAPNLIFAQIDSSLLKHKYQLKGYPSYFLYKDDSLVTYKSGILSDQKIRNVFYGEN